MRWGYLLEVRICTVDFEMPRTFDQTSAVA